jgi:nicotinamide-nucleotide amidase
MLPDLIRRGRTPSVGITVSEATITLRITASGASEQECYELMQPTIDTVHECLGSLVYGYEDDELEHVVLRLLAQRGQTLATAEIGTAGLAAKCLGDVPDERGCYLAGHVLPTSAALLKQLGLSAEVLAGHPLASGKVVEALASRSRELVDADYGLAVSAFPPSDAAGQPPGRVYFGLATRMGVIHRSTPFAGHPAILKSRAAKQALNMLRLELLGELRD